MRSVLTCLALCLAACGGSVDAASSGQSAPPPGDGQWSPVDPDDPPELRPTSCHPGARFVERFDLHEVSGAYSYFNQVLVLESGDVLAQSHDALARRRSGSSVWEALPALPFNTGPKLEATLGETIWMGSQNPTRVSIDGGVSWTPFLVADEHVTGAVPQHLGDGVVALGVDGGIVLATAPDAPGTAVALPYEKQAGRFTDNTIETLVRAGDHFVAIDTFGTVARANDPLGPWELGAALPDGAELVWLGDRLLAMTFDGTTYWSFDGALSWQPAGSGAERGDYGSELDVAIALGDGTVVATAHRGIQLSCDLGASFETLSLPETGETVHHLEATAEGDVWIASSYRLFRVEVMP